MDTRPRTSLISFCTVQLRTLCAAHSLATLCLFMTSGPDFGELPGFWGSMVFRHAPIPRKGSGKQQQQLVIQGGCFNHQQFLIISLSYVSYPLVDCFFKIYRHSSPLSFQVSPRNFFITLAVTFLVFAATDTAHFLIAHFLILTIVRAAHVVNHNSGYFSINSVLQPFYTARSLASLHSKPPCPS